MAAHTTTGEPGTEGGGEETPDTGGVQQQPVKSTSTTGGEIHADTNGMRAGARMFDSTADYASGIEGRFLGGTSRLEGVWGTDDTGKNFETEYRRRIVAATDALKSIREGLVALPESVDGWAQSYAQAEEDNAAIADGLAREAETQSSPIYQPGTGAAQPEETRQYAMYTHPVQGPVSLAQAGRDGGDQPEARRYATPVRLDRGLGLVRQASAGDGGDQPETRRYAMQARTVHGPVRQAQPTGDGGEHDWIPDPETGEPLRVVRRVPMPEPTYGLGTAQVTGSTEGALPAAPAPARQLGAAEGVAVGWGTSAPAPEPIRNADGTVTVTDWITDPDTGELVEVVRRVPMQTAPKPLDDSSSASPG